jgi:hypothetical protein
MSSSSWDGVDISIIWEGFRAGTVEFDHHEHAVPKFTSQPSS